MPEPRPQTDHAQAIEAGTVAIHDEHCHPRCTESLTTMSAYAKDAQVAYDAMAPLIRRAVAEEIAAAVEARKPSASHFWDTADAAHVYAYNAAATIAREIGERHA